MPPAKRQKTSYSGKSERVSKSNRHKVVSSVSKRGPKKGTGLTKAWKREVDAKLNSQISTFTRKEWDTGRFFSNTVNKVGYKNILGANNATLDDTGSAIEVYNPELNSGAGGLELKNLFRGGSDDVDHVTFRLVHSKLEIRNNSSTPVRLTVYTVTPKSGKHTSTNAEPDAAMVNGFDKDAVAGDVLMPHVYPTEIEAFRHQWRIEDTTHMTLNPGESLTQKYSYNKRFKFHQDNVATGLSVAEKRYGSHQYLLRAESCIVHDMTSTQLVGIDQFQLDYILEKKIVLEYDAQTPGGPLHRFGYYTEEDTVVAAQHVNWAAPDIIKK